MATKKIEIDCSDLSDADYAIVEKAFKAFKKCLKPKELDRLRQIVLYEPTVLATARTYLKL